jgi:hypothetical protein
VAGRWNGSVSTNISLVTTFLLVCALEGVAGYLLWSGHQAGAILALALLPAGAVFWWGFALPLPPLFALARTVLILLGWPRLKLLAPVRAPPVLDPGPPG